MSRTNGDPLATVRTRALLDGSLTQAAHVPVSERAAVRVGHLLVWTGRFPFDEYRRGAATVTARATGTRRVAMEGLPPIETFYGRLHEHIRCELGRLTEHVLTLDTLSQTQADKELKTIQKKLKFVSQVYNYHSVAEDEVNTPSTHLDRKLCL